MEKYCGSDTYKDSVFVYITEAEGIKKRRKLMIVEEIQAFLFNFFLNGCGYKNREYFCRL